MPLQPSWTCCFTMSEGLDTCFISKHLKTLASKLQIDHTQYPSCIVLKTKTIDCTVACILPYSYEFMNILYIICLLCSVLCSALPPPVPKAAARGPSEERTESYGRSPTEPWSFPVSHQHHWIRGQPGKSKQNHNYSLPTSLPNTFC